MFALTTDLSDGFFEAVEDMADNLGGAPLDPLCVWMSESGIKATAYNPDGGASGIFQAMPATLKHLGWPGTPDDFRQLSAERQVMWAYRYYAPYAGQLVSRAAWYVATFLPADIELAADPSAVLVQRDGRRGWAYTANAVFDANHDLKIQVSELEDAITRSCRGPRWAEIDARMSDRLNLPSDPQTQWPPYDLGTTLGIQEALEKLGFPVGPLDGILGPLTRAALKSFQMASGIAADGIPGPVTRKTLEVCLAKSRPPMAIG